MGLVAPHVPLTSGSNLAAVLCNPLRCLLASQARLLWASTAAVTSQLCFPCLETSRVVCTLFHRRWEVGTVCSRPPWFAMDTLRFNQQHLSFN